MQCCYFRFQGLRVQCRHLRSGCAHTVLSFTRRGCNGSAVVFDLSVYVQCCHGRSGVLTLPLFMIREVTCSAVIILCLTMGKKYWACCVDCFIFILESEKTNCICSVVTCNKGSTRHCTRTGVIFLWLSSDRKDWICTVVPVFMLISGKKGWMCSVVLFLVGAHVETEKLDVQSCLFSCFCVKADSMDCVRSSVILLGFIWRDTQLEHMTPSKIVLAAIYNTKLHENCTIYTEITRIPQLPSGRI